MAAKKQKKGTRISLNGSGQMPVIGFGTWGGADQPGVVGKAVRDALTAGFRMIDCAECYGNEKEIGAELQKYLQESKMCRSDLFVTSKVWNTNHAPQHVREACMNTLKNLQLDYLDLYLVHWPLAWHYVGEAPFQNGCHRAVNHARVGLHEYGQRWKALLMRERSSISESQTTLLFS
eukprot:TRINITY_DN109714_c0_g1_i1.p1 TRINITY_DN109714_c0_g1~~TRINITY_DN109714_c0_g1_i1.p1  ORF type:complete len:177 (+),score=26.42 TRINITY_DN109714_c0_g1_i1:84-614(+)